MEIINDFIILHIDQELDIENSFCETAQSNTHIFLNFGLYANDCLFDLAKSSYFFKITIDKSYLEKYQEQLELNIEKQSICCNTQSKLLEIINCKLTGLHRKIFLESQILFLLYQSQKNNLIFQLQCDSCDILNKPIELNKIQNARKFILEHLSENITIPIIAAQVGTNQCYLKKGFKEIYRQTIFEFIQENRMIKARHLLQSPVQNITEIAHEVGYSSLSSFSQAYKNYFGMSPTDQLKQIISNN
ncbi:MAG TPA: AraC family transcriptional regulator [Saprospiraceae bacterium]|nr:AraC family transcriptional regulator [Saprospiraceae bacterium]